MEAAANLGALLGLRDVSKSFGATAALRGVSLEVQPGEFHALVGENGAGKSTIVKIIAGIHPQTSGSLEWEGNLLPALSPTDVHRLGIGVVHQDSSVLNDLSVEGNFALGREPVRRTGFVDWPSVRRSFAARCERFGVELSPRMSARRLAVGDRKILEILKVLDDHQKLLVLDEPTASFTTEETRRLMGILLEIKAGGVSILYVTHRLEEIAGVVDRVTVLRDGANVATLQKQEATRDRVVSLMVGRDLGEIYPLPARPRQDILLSAKGVSRGNEFRNCDFVVHRGEIVAFVGLAGHGSFDVARAVFGTPAAEQGTFSMAGRDVRIRNLGDALRFGIGFLGDDRADNVLRVLSVRENIALASVRKWSHLGFQDKKRQAHEAKRLISDMSVRCQSDNAAMASLSGGNQQKVALGRWLALDVQLLVLLDPTAGIDVGARADIYRLLRDFADSGRGVLVATSDLAEAVGLADTIYAFYKGSEVAEFPRENRRQANVLAAITGHGSGGIAA
jgi:ABC-type sugar transport system ATPase subunit